MGFPESYRLSEGIRTRRASQGAGPEAAGAKRVTGTGRGHQPIAPGRDFQGIGGPGGDYSGQYSLFNACSKVNGQSWEKVSSGSRVCRAAAKRARWYA